MSHGPFGINPSAREYKEQNSRPPSRDHVRRPGAEQVCGTILNRSRCKVSLSFTRLLRSGPASGDLSDPCERPEAVPAAEY